MLGLLIALIMAGVPTLIKRPKWSEILCAAVTGSIMGVFLDFIASSFWSYPRIPFGTLTYLLIVVPAWSLYAIMTWSTWKLTKNVLLTTLIVMIATEGINLIMGSWSYTTPLWVFALLWTPLVAGTLAAIAVVNKLWRLLFEQPTTNTDSNKISNRS